MTPDDIIRDLADTWKLPGTEPQPPPCPEATAKVRRLVEQRLSEGAHTWDVLVEAASLSGRLGSGSRAAITLEELIELVGPLPEVVPAHTGDIADGIYPDPQPPPESAEDLRDVEKAVRQGFGPTPDMGVAEAARCRQGCALAALLVWHRHEVVPVLIRLLEAEVRQIAEACIAEAIRRHRRARKGGAA
jgi:hypothetical protein